MARKYTLEKYVEKVGFQVAAKKLGATPSALSIAITNKRAITVSVESSGEVSASEVKGFPSRTQSPKATDHAQPI